MYRWLFLIASLSLGTTPRASLRAQTPTPRPTIALVDMTFYGANANSIEPGDSAVARVATARLRGVLHDAGAFALADSARTAAEVARADRLGIPCNTNVDCSRRVGESVGARWIVMGRVSKISNLIWYLSAQLIDVATGKFALDDQFELKGPRDEMVPRGAESLARRIQTAALRDTSDR